MVETMLRNVTMFSQLPDDVLEEVNRLLKPRSLAAGQVIFNKGDPGEELIIVSEGKIAIYDPVEGSPEKGQPIRVFAPGGLLGEMALVDQKPRSLSARAEEPSGILALSRADFNSLLGRSPQLAVSVMAGLSDRIRYTTDFLGEVRQWVQRVTSGNYQAGTTGETHQYHDPTLATLAADFAHMAATVKEREDTLKQEVAKLRIEIDEARRKEEVSRIVGSDYFQSLKEKAKDLRKKNE